MLKISFKKDGFVVVRNIIDDASEYNSYVEDQMKENKGEQDFQVPNAKILYKTEKTEKLLKDVKGRVEKATGMKLFKTYSFIRKYTKGMELKKHTDRNACEISVSICLGYKGTPLWKIWLTDLNGKDHGVELKEGDAIIFRGTELTHWRDKMENDEQTQVFLHYVDRTGEHYMFRDDENRYNDPKSNCDKPY